MDTSFVFQGAVYAEHFMFSLAKVSYVVTKKSLDFIDILAILFPLEDSYIKFRIYTLVTKMFVFY